MSVRVSDRGESSTQYIGDVINLNTLLIEFLYPVATRHDKIISIPLSMTMRDIVAKATLLDRLVKSNYKDETLYKQTLIEYYGLLDALDFQLTMAYKSLLKAPNVAFVKNDRVVYSKREAKQKINKVSEKLGEQLYQCKLTAEKMLNNEQ